jgi:hypothetical protein
MNHRFNVNGTPMQRNSMFDIKGKPYGASPFPKPTSNGMPGPRFNVGGTPFLGGSMFDVKGKPFGMR